MSKIRQVSDEQAAAVAEVVESYNYLRELAIALFTDSHAHQVANYLRAVVVSYTARDDYYRVGCMNIEEQIRFALHLAAEHHAANGEWLDNCLAHNGWLWSPELRAVFKLFAYARDNHAMHKMVRRHWVMVSFPDEEMGA